MGFIGRIERPAVERREMGTRDFIWLATLGTTARRPADVEDICAAIDAITSGQWLPVGDLVVAAIEEMLRGGHLMWQDGHRLAPSERGAETLSLLLVQPAAAPSTVCGQVAVRLKLAFLDLLPPPEQRTVLDCLVTAYQEELRRRQPAATPCPVRGSFGELWRSHDLDRLRRDIALLRNMAGMAAAGTPSVHH